MHCSVWLLWAASWLYVIMSCNIATVVGVSRVPYCHALLCMVIMSYIMAVCHHELQYSCRSRRITRWRTVMHCSVWLLWAASWLCVIMSCNIAAVVGVSRGGVLSCIALYGYYELHHGSMGLMRFIMRSDLSFPWLIAGEKYVRNLYDYLLWEEQEINDRNKNINKLDIEQQFTRMNNISISLL